MNRKQLMKRVVRIENQSRHVMMKTRMAIDLKSSMADVFQALLQDYIRMKEVHSETEALYASFNADIEKEVNHA